MMPAEVFRREVYARSVVPAQERVKESELRATGRLRSVIPAKAGIHLSSWNKLLYGYPPSRVRRCGPDFNWVADFFTRSFAGMTPVRQRYAQQLIDGACPAFRPPYSFHVSD